MKYIDNFFKKYVVYEHNSEYQYLGQKGFRAVLSYLQVSGLSKLWDFK